MRQLLVISTIFLTAGLAAAQATVVSGYASNWRLAPGAYAEPFVPLVTTPSVSLNSPPVPATPFARPMWYAPAAPMVEVQVPAANSQSAPQEPGFRFGAARFQSSYGAAQLAPPSHGNNAGVKIYTNQNIAPLNQNLGTVKYGDKTEHLQ
jgi:hypothetical protein